MRRLNRVLVVLVKIELERLRKQPVVFKVGRPGKDNGNFCVLTELANVDCNQEY